MLDVLKSAFTTKGLGVKPECTAFEAMSATEEENAQFAAAMLLGVRSLLLVTDSGHMLRAKLTFESFGFRVIEGMCDLIHAKNAAAIVFARYVREYVGVMTYAVRGFHWRRGVKSRYLLRALQYETMAKIKKKIIVCVKFL